MNFFRSVLGGAAKIDIALKDAAERQVVEIPTSQEGKTEKLPLYIENEAVVGSVSITIDNSSKKLEHMGISVALVGVIKMNGNIHEFMNIVKDLEPAGILTENKSYDFNFETNDRSYESYNGINAFLNYYVRVNISRSMATKITKQIEFWQRNYSNPPDTNSNIKMEVGIEDCLHIEFEYNKSKYHLKDVIIGKIYFLLVRLKIKTMNISLLKRETTGSGPDVYNENRTLSKFEIMDGAPVRGEAIPVRLFLGGFDLTPTYKDVVNKFSVTYILNLVLVDEDDRRYFKQREIVLWRKADRAKKYTRIEGAQTYEEGLPTDGGRSPDEE
ncbi:vacuolar protein sorting-associated protein 26 [Planoprotostelium fungivorum]|uniref:Vacuolar protein sorting-associated protein 26 n=1 Tax=Planoprotostelium fungivorum TaxID=1890364 RepID=A0A2P6MXP1_9EUKA|nr:vacuolar protein sorting-associated protein 26 [Planoprotostelium fungivorum]